MEATEFFHNIKTPATVVHVLSVVLGMGGALTSDILFSFFSKDKKLNKTELFTLSILKNVVHYSLILIVVSGLVIFMFDMEKYMASAKFLAKMSILFVLVANGYLLNKYIWPHLLNRNFFTLKKERNIRRLAFACGAVSVISWLAVCALGVLNKINVSYEFIMLTYLVIVLFGVITALILERKEFN